MPGPLIIKLKPTSARAAPKSAQEGRTRRPAGGHVSWCLDLEPRRRLWLPRRVLHRVVAGHPIRGHPLPDVRARPSTPRASAARRPADRDGRARIRAFRDYAIVLQGWPLVASIG